MRFMTSWMASNVVTRWPLRLTSLSLFFFLAGCVTTPETGRSAFILTSEAQEKALGEQAFQEVIAKERLSQNKRWTELIQRVGKRIAAAANQPDYDWEFRLVESKEKNAFCLPGGKVVFYTGILPSAQTEAAVAAIMGHEVAHATARHAGQRITLALGTQLGMAALSGILGEEDSQEKQLLMAAIGVGATVGATLPFSRANESEADEIGLVYMARAGYDPREAPRFWERFARENAGNPPEFLSTHPSSEGRQQRLLEQLPKVLPLYERSPKFGLGERL